MMRNPIPNAPSSRMAYAGVVKAATATAKSLGAAVVKDVTEVAGAGWFSIITDPAGAVLGLWEQKKACCTHAESRPGHKGVYARLRRAMGA
jgi:hypothetical protein